MDRLKTLMQVEINVSEEDLDNHISNDVFTRKQINISEIGKPPIWNTPLDMYNSFQDYFQYVINNPLMSVEIHGKNPMACKIPKMRIMTILGYCVYCGSIYSTFNDYEKKQGYSDVCQYIKTAISSYNIEGASAFQLQPNIVSRIEGLVDKKQVDVNSHQKVVLYVPELPAPTQAQLEAGDENLVEGEDWELL